jgi:hypothetical protein
LTRHLAEAAGFTPQDDAKALRERLGAVLTAAGVSSERAIELLTGMIGIGNTF